MKLVRGGWFTIQRGIVICERSTMEEDKELITEDVETGNMDMENNIYNKVYTIRGKQVMLDFDLAQMDMK